MAEDPKLSENPKLELLRLLDYRAELAKELGVTPAKLRFLLYSGPRSRFYREFTIAKRSGGTRTIRAPRHDLKDMQRSLAAKLTEIYRPRACVFGYVEGRNIKQNAKVHRSRRWTLRVDFTDFFPSIHFGRVFGLFRAMGIQREVAVTMAQICCDDDGLPQGAPTSPVVSNLLCGRMDRELSHLCRKTRCSYTRYCDDLVFSTRRKQFSPSVYDHENGHLGATVRRIIEDHGFEVNPDKTTLRGTAHRQMVTGLVVNDFVNVPRHFVRSLRTLIYMCGRYGLESAGKHYLANHDRKNRPPGKKPPEVTMIIRGKLEYLRSIKGDADPVYQQLASRYAAIDGGFSYSPPQYALPVIRVRTEGETDVIHFEAALRAFKAKKEFTSLTLRVEHRVGDSNLLKTLQELESETPKDLTVGIFDRDKPDVVGKVTANGDPKRWNENLYSLVIPAPSFRAGGDLLCVELLYPDEVLKTKDDDGRRIYPRSEFHEGGAHLEGPEHLSDAKHKGLIAERVFIRRASVGLTKMAFAKLVEEGKEPFESVDFEGFRGVFETLEKIASDWVTSHGS